MEKLLIPALWVLSVLAGGFIGFMAAYLKKKGENLATHEDLDKLVEQVRAVTTTTKEIEAKISTDVWGRQKQWELRRDVLFDATKRLGAVNNALIALESAYQVSRQHEQQGKPVLEKEKTQAGERSMGALREFGETCLLMGVVCGEEVRNACDDFCRFARNVSLEILREDKEIYDKSMAELTKKFFVAMAAIRKELGTDKTN